jgi:hypothetical protein
MSIEGGNKDLYSSSFQEGINAFERINNDQIKNASPKARKAFLNAGKALNTALARLKKDPNNLPKSLNLVEANTRLRVAADKLSKSQKKSGILAKIGRIFGYVVGKGASQSETHMGLGILKHSLIRELTPPKKNS